MIHPPQLGRRRLCLTAGAVMAASLAVSACTVTGVGVDGTVSAGYVGGYYEPYGYDYGGWGPGYRVAPWRDGHHFDHPHGPGPGFGGRRPAPAYRPAPIGRPSPSLPGRPRGR